MLHITRDYDRFTYSAIWFFAKNRPWRDIHNNRWTPPLIFWSSSWTTRKITMCPTIKSSTVVIDWSMALTKIHSVNLGDHPHDTVTIINSLTFPQAGVEISDCCHPRKLPLKHNVMGGNCYSRGINPLLDCIWGPRSGTDGFGAIWVQKFLQRQRLDFDHSARGRDFLWSRTDRVCFSDAPWPSKQ